MRMIIYSFDQLIWEKRYCRFSLNEDVLERGGDISGILRFILLKRRMIKLKNVLIIKNSFLKTLKNKRCIDPAKSKVIAHEIFTIDISCFFAYVIEIPAQRVDVFEV